MTTHTVATAWKKLCERPEIPYKAFKQCGISIAPDGSEDHLIKIKDIPAKAIDFTGWERENQVTEEDEDHEISQSGDNINEFELQGEDILPANNYCTLLGKELKDLCRQRSLPTSGNKAALIERLERADNSSVDTAL